MAYWTAASGRVPMILILSMVVFAGRWVPRARSARRVEPIWKDATPLKDACAEAFRSCRPEDHGAAFDLVCQYEKRPQLALELIQCSGGDEGDRTPDLFTASQALSH